MKTHAFDSTGEAYDAVQCDDDIGNGDVLDVASEGVVGLAYTWPVAVTAEAGKLHRIGSKPGALEGVMGDAGWSKEQVRAAVALAVERGHEVAEAFQAYAPSVPTP
jgi:hypothetical protein